MGDSVERLESLPLSSEAALLGVLERKRSARFGRAQGAAERATPAREPPSA